MKKSKIPGCLNYSVSLINTCAPCLDVETTNIKKEKRNQKQIKFLKKNDLY